MFFASPQKTRTHAHTHTHTHEFAGMSCALPIIEPEWHRCYGDPQCGAFADKFLAEPNLVVVKLLDSTMMVNADTGEVVWVCDGSEGDCWEFDWDREKTSVVRRRSVTDAKLNDTRVIAEWFSPGTGTLIAQCVATDDGLEMAAASGSVKSCPPPATQTLVCGDRKFTMASEARVASYSPSKPTRVEVLVSNELTGAAETTWTFELGMYWFLRKFVPGYVAYAIQSRNEVRVREIVTGHDVCTFICPDAAIPHWFPFWTLDANNGKIWLSTYHGEVHCFKFTP